MGLALVALAASGVVILVADLMYPWMASVLAAVTMAAWFGWLWFALPLLRPRPGR